ncbi:MAG: hypothetical protein N2449_07055 [Bacteroidales bacterium]|nr:hypothetical protein [Bacteroidales bacterium]
MLKLVILALIIVGIAVIGLSISLLIKRNGKFPNIHIEQNEALKKEGIKCASHDEEGCRGCSCEINN